jgi:uncharacterized protein (TIGR03086 family)
MTVRALIDHVRAFAGGFRAAALKTFDEPPDAAEAPAAGEPLEAGWRDEVARDLRRLADAWDQPSAWEGMTRAGGIDLPGEMAGRVALEELVVHAWDLARATGQRFEADDRDLADLEGLAHQLRAGNDGELPGLYGPVVATADEAPLLDRVLGLTGRDPAWSP